MEHLNPDLQKIISEINQKLFSEPVAEEKKEDTLNK